MVEILGQMASEGLVSAAGEDRWKAAVVPGAEHLQSLVSAQKYSRQRRRDRPLSRFVCPPRSQPPSQTPNPASSGNVAPRPPQMSTEETKWLLLELVARAMPSGGLSPEDLQEHFLQRSNGRQLDNNLLVRFVADPSVQLGFTHDPLHGRRVVFRTGHTPVPTLGTLSRPPAPGSASATLLLGGQAPPGSRSHRPTPRACTPARQDRLRSAAALGFL